MLAASADGRLDPATELGQELVVLRPVDGLAAAGAGDLFGLRRLEKFRAGFTYMMRRLLRAAHELGCPRPHPGVRAAFGLARHLSIGQLAELGLAGIAESSRRALALAGELRASLPDPGVLATGTLAGQLLIGQPPVAVQAA